MSNAHEHEKASDYVVRPPVRGLSCVQGENHGITILHHLHQCRPCTSQDISCLSW